MTDDAALPIPETAEQFLIQEATRLRNEHTELQKKYDTAERQRVDIKNEIKDMATRYGTCCATCRHLGPDEKCQVGQYAYMQYCTTHWQPRKKAKKAAVSA